MLVRSLPGTPPGRWLEKTRKVKVAQRKSLHVALRTSTPAPAASGDTMSKGDSSKMMKKTSKKKASKMKSDDAK